MKTVRIAKEDPPVAKSPDPTTKGVPGSDKAPKGPQAKFKPDMLARRLREAGTFELVLVEGSSLKGCRCVDVDMFNLAVTHDKKTLVVPKHSVLYAVLEQ